MKILVILSLFMCSVALAAPQTYTLEVHGTELGGTGAELLKNEIEKAQFILYGEDHGFADSPIVLRAIAKMARPIGFTHLVIEVGPLSTAMLTRTLSNG